MSLLLTIDFETGDTSAFSSTFGSPVVSGTSPIQGAYSLLTTGNAHATIDLPGGGVDDLFTLHDIQYSTAPSSTRNIFAVRSSSSEIASIRVQSDAKARVQLGGSTLFTTTGTVGTGDLPLSLRVKRNSQTPSNQPGTGLIEFGAWSGDTFNLLYSAAADVPDQPYALRIGGLNGGHDGTHRSDMLQAATTDILVPWYVTPTGITNRVDPPRLTGRLGGLVS